MPCSESFLTHWTRFTLHLLCEMLKSTTVTDCWHLIRLCTMPIGWDVSCVMFWKSCIFHCCQKNGYSAFVFPQKFNVQEPWVPSFVKYAFHFHRNSALPFLAVWKGMWIWTCSNLNVGFVMINWLDKMRRKMVEKAAGVWWEVALCCIYEIYEVKKKKTIFLSSPFLFTWLSPILHLAPFLCPICWGWEDVSRWDWLLNLNAPGGEKETSKWLG